MNLRKLTKCKRNKELQLGSRMLPSSLSIKRIQTRISGAWLIKFGILTMWTNLGIWTKRRPGDLFKTLWATSDLEMNFLRKHLMRSLWLLTRTNLVRSKNLKWLISSKNSWVDLYKKWSLNKWSRLKTLKRLTQLNKNSLLVFRGLRSTNSTQWSHQLMWI